MLALNFGSSKEIDMRIEANVTTASPEYTPNPTADSSSYDDTNTGRNTRCVVSGKIHLTLNKPITATSLIVELSGDRSVSWIDKTSFGQMPYRSDINFLTYQCNLFGSLDTNTFNSPRVPLEEGTHCLPFELPIITKNLPPTIKTSSANIKYEVRATLSSTKWSTIVTTATKASAPITIGHLPGQIFGWLPKYTSQIELKGGHPDWFTGQLMVPTCLWCVGNQVPLRLILQPHEVNNSITGKRQARRRRSICKVTVTALLRQDVCCKMPTGLSQSNSSRIIAKDYQAWTNSNTISRRSSSSVSSGGSSAAIHSSLSSSATTPMMALLDNTPSTSSQNSSRRSSISYSHNNYNGGEDEKMNSFASTWKLSLTPSPKASQCSALTRCIEVSHKVIVKVLFEDTSGQSCETVLSTPIKLTTSSSLYNNSVVNLVDAIEDAPPRYEDCVNDELVLSAESSPCVSPNLPPTYEHSGPNYRRGRSRRGSRHVWFMLDNTPSDTNPSPSNNYGNEPVDSSADLAVVEPLSLS
ncbi:hypothetical protein H4219_004887 [Mycoemilia scoparia]|uniref:Arrestin-like N-terminal domain-containing protein n=1 Tax=Mycoemilia scoparia TaxID=417184 RepID=A0A9W7ZR38_9FUNG|nr:hypothetical protein H4219_004887 [Mycoemilia scoparia]